MPFFGGGPNYTNITRHSIDKLHHAIKSNPQGNMFTLYKVKLAKKNVGCLANALNNYPHITQLDVVYSITLTDTSLMEVSSKCDYITSLDFMHCALMASHVLALCDAIRLRPKIRSLKLSKTRLCTLAIRHISDLVETSKTLEELSITCETLNRTAVCALALALSNNTSLTSLVLKKDNISAEDSLFIARALCVNTTLQSIDLSTNNISGECVGIILRGDVASRGNVTSKDDPNALPADVVGRQVDALEGGVDAEGAGDEQRVLGADVVLLEDQGREAGVIGERQGQRAHGGAVERLAGDGQFLQGLRRFYQVADVPDGQGTEARLGQLQGPDLGPEPDRVAEGQHVRRHEGAVHEVEAGDVVALARHLHQ